MKFVKYNDNKSVTIPPAVLTVCGLDDEGKLEMAGAKGAVILSKSEMTAMEMVRTILALTNRAGSKPSGQAAVQGASAHSIHRADSLFSICSAYFISLPPAR